MEPAVDALIEHIEGNVEDFDEADADQGDDLDVDDLKGLGKKKDSKATDESASVEGAQMIAQLDATVARPEIAWDGLRRS